MVGTIPLVYAISGRSIAPFYLDSLQQHELLLTVAQSLFAVAALVNLRLESHEGVLLFALFSAHLIVEEIRPEVMEIYIVLAAVSQVLNRKALIPAARMGLGLTQKD